LIDSLDRLGDLDGFDLFGLDGLGVGERGQIAREIRAARYRLCAANRRQLSLGSNDQIADPHQSIEGQLSGQRGLLRALRDHSQPRDLGDPDRIGVAKLASDGGQDDGEPTPLPRPHVDRRQSVVFNQIRSTARRAHVLCCQ
jgi:hypothetical protein